MAYVCKGETGRSAVDPAYSLNLFDVTVIIAVCSRNTVTVAYSDSHAAVLRFFDPAYLKITNSAVWALK